jgi:hypothetical protein
MTRSPWHFQRALVTGRLASACRCFCLPPRASQLPDSPAALAMTSCVHETAVEHHDNQSDDVRFAKALALAARCDEGPGRALAADTASGSGTAAALRLFKPAYTAPTVR